MPELLNNMLKKMKSEKISSAFLQSFFHYILLYKKLSELYPKEISNVYKNEINMKTIASIINKLMILTIFEKIQSFEKYLIELKYYVKNKIAIEFF